MFSQVNPQDKEMHVDASSKQTVEIRSADCSADIYQLLSALCVACRYGLELPNGSK